MKIKLGMIVESEFGKGEVLAFTSKWVIHNDSENGNPDEEYAVFHEDTPVFIFIELPKKPESKISELEI
jgi:hypothetical protein